MRGNIERFLEIKIIDLIPDTFFILGDVDSLYPVRCAIEDTVAIIRIHVWIFLRDAKRDRNLTYLSFFGDLKFWLLIIYFDRLDPPGISIAIIDLIPYAVIWVSWLSIFIDGRNVKNFICPKETNLIRVKSGRIVQRDTAPGDTSMFGSGCCKGAVQAQIFQRKSQSPCAGKFEKFTTGELWIEHGISLTANKKSREPH